MIAGAQRNTYQPWFVDSPNPTDIGFALPEFREEPEHQASSSDVPNQSKQEQQLHDWTPAALELESTESPEWLPPIPVALFSPSSFASHESPLRWLSRQITSLSASHSNDNRSDRTPQLARTQQLLALLANSPSDLRNRIYTVIVGQCTAAEILGASLAQYELTYQERYLVQAVSLLETLGSRSWSVLRWLSNTNRSECELFLGLIARCPGVSVEERYDALRRLTKHAHSEVRARVIEHAHEVGAHRQRALLEVLSNDADSEIKEEAEGFLAEF